MSQVDLPLEKVIDVCIDDFFCHANKIERKFNFTSIWLVLHLWSSHVQTNWCCCNGFPVGSDSCHKMFMSFEKQWLSACAPDILTKDMLTKDDISLMSLFQSHLNDLVSYVNTKHQSITFTYKFEKNDSFWFLDVKTTRSNNKLVTSVFYKSTFSVVSTNYKSFFLPFAFNFGLI